MRCFIVLFVFGLVGLCSWSYHRVQVADHDFERLLTGDDDVSLVAVEIQRQKMQIVLDDAESIKYFSNMLRSAQIAGGKGVASVSPEFGPSYYMNARLSTGALIKCSIYIPKRTDCLTLLFPIDGFGDGIYYLVILDEPVPGLLFKILSDLR